MPESDAYYIERAREGDADALGALVRRHFGAAYAVALAQTGNRADAEDVCQDAFVRVLERIESCRNPERFAAWLFQIVRNVAANRRDYENVRAGISLDEITRDSGLRTDCKAETSELRELLLAALDRLTNVQREVVLLHEVEGWPHRDISGALGISEVMSRRHLSDARSLLRTIVGHRLFEDYIHG